MPISRNVGSRPLVAASGNNDHGTIVSLLGYLNSELIPLVREMRSALNRWLSPPFSLIIDGEIVSIDWTRSRSFTLALSDHVTQIGMVDPADAGWYELIATQVGGGFTLTGWPANVRWFGGGVAPTVTPTSGRTDMIRLWFDGTSYLGYALQDAS